MVDLARSTPGETRRDGRSPPHPRSGRGPVPRQPVGHAGAPTAVAIATDLEFCGWLKWPNVLSSRSERGRRTTSGRRSDQIWPAMAPSDSHLAQTEGSGEKSGCHRASCSPSHTVSGCLGDDQPRSFDHLRSIPSASALRDRWREQADCTCAAARLADAVEARAGLVSATTMRDGDTASKGLNART